MASKTYLNMKMTDGNDKAVNEGRTGNRGIEGNNILMISPGAALHTIEMQMEASSLVGSLWHPDFWADPPNYLEITFASGNACGIPAVKYTLNYLTKDEDPVGIYKYMIHYGKLTAMYDIQVRAYADNRSGWVDHIFYDFNPGGPSNIKAGYFISYEESERIILERLWAIDPSSGGESSPCFSGLTYYDLVSDMITTDES